MSGLASIKASSPRFLIRESSHRNLLLVLNMSLAVDPAAATVPAAGGVATHNLVNSGAARLAFKVKSSNNTDYRLKPVFGFVEAGASAPLEITRTAGAPKEDKLVIQFIEAAADAADAAELFKAAPAGAPQVVLPIKAE